MGSTTRAFTKSELQETGHQRVLVTLGKPDLALSPSRSFSAALLAPLSPGKPFSS